MARADVDFDNLTNDIVIYDLDNDVIRTPVVHRQGNTILILVTSFPVIIFTIFIIVLLSHYELMTMIATTLRPKFVNGDNIVNDDNLCRNDTTTNTKAAISIYKDFVSSLLKTSANHCISFSDKTSSIIFLNEYSYIKDVTDGIDNPTSSLYNCDTSFIMAFIRTQCFSNYIASNRI